MTRGLRSSEFIVAMFGLIVGAFLDYQGITNDSFGKALLVAGAYVGGRSVVKFKQGE